MKYGIHIKKIVRWCKKCLPISIEKSNNDDGFISHGWLVWHAFLWACLCARGFVSCFFSPSAITNVHIRSSLDSPSFVRSFAGSISPIFLSNKFRCVFSTIFFLSATYFSTDHIFAIENKTVVRFCNLIFFFYGQQYNKIRTIDLCLNR